MPGGYDVSAVAGSVLVKSLDADHTTSSTTPDDVEGLTVALGLGRYVFNYYIIAQSGATTTGHKLAVNFTGTVTRFANIVRWLTAASAAADDVADQDHIAAPGGVVSGFSHRAVKTTASTGQTTDVDAINADVLYIIEGICLVTVAGNLELWHGSEAAAASSVMAGSSLLLFKTG